MVKSGKIQKKSFFEVSSSITATKIHLYSATVAELDGKVVKIDLTRSLRGKSLELKLRVKAEGEKLNSEPISLELAGSYIRRAFRKGADYIEDSFSLESKDSKILVKPFMLTRNKVSRAVRKTIRNNTKEFLTAYMKTRTSKELFTEIMTNKIQKELSLKLKKVYPLALCEIRFFKVLGSKEFKADEKKEDVKEAKKLLEKQIEVREVAKETAAEAEQKVPKKKIENEE